MISLFKKHWQGEGGVKDILTIAFPLILGSSSITIMYFCDRRFLASYSIESFEAAAPAGMLSYLVGSLFMGVIVYINTFVSQYYGADRKERIGSVMWQAIYVAIISSLCMLPLYFFAVPIFDLVGHAPKLRPYEVSYFEILILGELFVYLNTALTTFFRGQKKTKEIMLIRFFTVILNIPLNYGLIFGHWGLPEMGIRGAAIATVISTACATVLITLMIFRKKYIHEYGLLRGFGFDGELLRRIFRFGIPNGFQFLIGMLSFSFFLLMIGRIGDMELAATNAAWTINSLAFIPMMGFGMAISIIVGNAVGAKRVDTAVRAVRLTFIMVTVYMVLVAAIYLLFPRQVLLLLLGGVEKAYFDEIFSHASFYLQLVAFYLIFDGAELVYFNAIKGAGDTKFTMWFSMISSLLLVGIPSYVFTVIYPQPASVLWVFSTAYFIISGTIGYLRYRSGKWKLMKVIEDFPAK